MDDNRTLQTKALDNSVSISDRLLAIEKMTDIPRLEWIAEKVGDTQLHLKAIERIDSIKVNSAKPNITPGQWARASARRISQEYRATRGLILDFEWARDGSKLAVRSEGGVVSTYVFDQTGLTLLRHVQPSPNIGYIAFSPDASSIVADYSEWPSYFGDYIAVLPFNDDISLSGLSWHPTRNLLVTTQRVGVFVGTKEQAGWQLRRLLDPSEQTRSFGKWSRSGDSFAMAYDRNVLQFFDAGGNQRLEINTEHGGDINRMEWSPDEGALATLSWDDDQIKVWNAVSGGLQSIIRYEGEGAKRISSFTWTRAGDCLIATTASRYVAMWDCNTGKQLLAFMPDADWTMHTVSMHPKANVLVLGGPGGRLSLWEIA